MYFFCAFVSACDFDRFQCLVFQLYASVFLAAKKLDEFRPAYLLYSCDIYKINYGKECGN